VATGWAKFVFEHKTPSVATFWTFDVEWLTAINTKFFTSSGCFSAFWTFKSAHFF
jgi:hypothetical protein